MTDTTPDTAMPAAPESEPRPMTGFFSNLSPEGQAAALAYDGPEPNIGDTAPEGQQEPVAWRCKDHADGWVVYGEKSAAERHQRNDNCLMQPLYTRPSEQAVTEEMVERAWARASEMSVRTAMANKSALREVITAALKAAMEAGR